MAKREKLQVIYDILNTLREKNGKLKQTHIQYKANLSSQMLKEYLDDLIEKDLIKEEIEKGGKIYKLTEKGYNYLNKYSMIVDFMGMFGIE